MQELMEKLHKINLQFLVDVDAIFKRHGIRYYLAAGTLLGSIRHKGFIPWDNDIDVTITRSEFEKAIPFLKAELDPSLYELVLPEDFGNHYRDMLPFIRYKKIRINCEKDLEDFYFGKANAVTFDFFILDKSYSGLRGKWHTIRLATLYGKLNAYRMKKPDYDGWMKIPGKILYALGKLTPCEKLEQKVLKTATRYNNDYNAPIYRVTNDLLSSLLMEFPIAWYDSGRNGDFENLKFPIPMEAEKALTVHFGNYMELPPVEKQLPHLCVFGQGKEAPSLTKEQFEFSD